MKSRKFLCAMSLILACTTVSAKADDLIVTLDVAFDNAVPDSPGTWDLLARIVLNGGTADGSNGLAAIRALLDGIDFGAGGDAVILASDIGAINPIDEGGPNERLPVLDLGGGTFDILYGQDISDSTAVIGGVGIGGDRLIVSGTFSAGQVPAFGFDGSFMTDANFLAQPAGSAQTAAFAPDNIILAVNTRVVPEPTSLVLLFASGAAFMVCRSRT